MAYKKDQGRYVRMAAFWSLLLLLAYGCLGGFVILMDGLLVRMLGKEAARAWIDPFPLIQRFGPAQLVALTVLAAGGWAIHRALNRPRVADLLIETEGELRKVTWPSSHETISGTVAVAVTVVVMFVFLIVADLLLTYVLHKAMGVV